MGKFDGVLLVSDFDDTLYDSHCQVPRRNLEALDRFLAQGGSVDFAMVPILIYCLRWGPAWSLSCCFVNGVLQFFLGGGIALSWQSMLLDYVVAYTLVFLCGFAAGKKLGWLWGTILAGLGRWVSLTLSGGLLWYMYMPEEFLGLPMVDPWGKRYSRK